VFKEQTIRDYVNYLMDPPYKTAQNIMMDTVIDRFWSPEAKSLATKEVTIEGLKQFIPRLLSQMKVNALAQGNITKQEINDLIKDLHSIVHCKPLLPQQLPDRRVVKLRKGHTYISQALVPNPQDNNSVVWIQYHIGLKSLREEVLLELVVQFVENPFYEQLRTKEQLGYVIWTLNQYMYGIGVFTLVLQSPEKSSEFLEERVESFLQSYKDELKDVSDEEFEVRVEGLRAAKMQKYNYLTEEMKANWSEISAKTYLFDRKEQFVQVLSTVTKVELCEYYCRHIADLSTRKKICFDLYGNQHTIPVDKGAAPNTHVILRGEEPSFRSKMHLVAPHFSR